MNTEPSFSRKLAARIISSFVWNREARHALRDAMLGDYKNEIRILKSRISEMEEVLKRSVCQIPLPPLSGSKKGCAYSIEGRNNRVILIEENGKNRLLGRDERVPGLEISICGDDNEIRIHRPCRLDRNTIQIGEISSHSCNNGVRIEICEGSTLYGVYLRCISGEKQIFRLGNGSKIWGAEIMLDEISGCVIGDDCECSNHIHIWGSDGHAILDKNDPSKILNEVEGPIVVGDHTWIGQSVRLQKNARIPPNTIIAAGSIVTKAFEEEYTILAGVPAKVIKRGVMREPKTLSAYLLKKTLPQLKIS